MTTTESRTEALTVLAEQFDAARISANAIADTAWQLSAYGDASNGMIKVLALLTSSEHEADYAYQAILDGSTVREALAYAKQETAELEEHDAICRPVIADHTFRVVNGRTSNVVLETHSWVAATECQYRNNEAESAVGYDPCFSLWVLDADGNTTLVKTQL